MNETLLEADSGGGIRNRLLLDGITPIQQGYYKCVINGSSSIEFRIDVLSGSGSKIGFRADTVAANVSESIGGTVRMHCSAVVDNGDPDWLPHHQLQIEWLRWIALPENASGQIHPNASVIISSAQFQSKKKKKKQTIHPPIKKINFFFVFKQLYTTIRWPCGWKTAGTPRRCPCSGLLWRMADPTCVWPPIRPEPLGPAAG